MRLSGPGNEDEYTDSALGLELNVLTPNRVVWTCFHMHLTLLKSCDRALLHSETGKNPVLHELGQVEV